jgi:hypothetical protein
MRKQISPDFVNSSVSVNSARHPRRRCPPP